jgi:uncharacterized protein
MPDEILEEYVKQTISAHKIPEVTFAWQGGEPTILGLEFFKRALSLQRKYKKLGMLITNTIQTNGIMLDDQWCHFLQQNNFLVGLSIDGPQKLHDAYRKDASGKGTFNRVMQGISLLKEHKVEFNILCTVNRANGDHPLEVYRFFRDVIGAQFVQFIPVVERNPSTKEVTPWSVQPNQLGTFLNGIFDEWVRHDVSKVYVQHFDIALANWYSEPHGICIFSPTCGQALVIEHNGDIYSCDHFVDPDHLLGNILRDPLEELIASPSQLQFGLNKQNTLPGFCKRCQFLFACHGECPKNRFIVSPDGEMGINYLCDGYRRFFAHIDEPMKFMVRELHSGRAPANVMRFMRRKPPI